MKILDQPKLAMSSDADWRKYYEDKCREQRKEIAALREAVVYALEVFDGKRFKAGVAQKLAEALRS